MTTLRSLVLSALAVAMVGSAAQSAAHEPAHNANSAAVRRAHAYIATVQATDLSHRGSPLVRGSTEINVGTERSFLGNGAIVAFATFTGPVRPGVYGFRVISKHYYADGSFTARGGGATTINPNGTVTTSYTGETVIGGAGRYRGASGRWAIAAVTKPSGTTTGTLHLHGRLTY